MNLLILSTHLQSIIDFFPSDKNSQQQQSSLTFFPDSSMMYNGIGLWPCFQSFPKAHKSIMKLTHMLSGCKRMSYDVDQCVFLLQEYFNIFNYKLEQGCTLLRKYERYSTERKVIFISFLKNSLCNGHTAKNGYLYKLINFSYLKKTCQNAKTFRHYE